MHRTAQRQFDTGRERPFFLPTHPSSPITFRTPVRDSHSSRLPHTTSFSPLSWTRVPSVSICLGNRYWKYGNKSLFTVPFDLFLSGFFQRVGTLCRSIDLVSKARTIAGESRRVFPAYGLFLLLHPLLRLCVIYTCAHMAACRPICNEFSAQKR